MIVFTVNNWVYWWFHEVECLFYDESAIPSSWSYVLTV